MSKSSSIQPAIPLDAAATMSPRSGDLVKILEGTVLAFAVDASGRRTLIAEVPSGEWVVGSDSTVDGTRLLVAGLPGTKVQASTLDANEHGIAAPFEIWAKRLGQVAGAQRWPERLLPLEGGTRTLEDGEHVGVGRESLGITWVRLMRGSATLCGYARAVITAQDPAIPLTGDTWLTARGSCEIAVVNPPDEPSSQRASMNAWGQLAMAAVAQYRGEQDLQALEQRKMRDAWANTAVGEAVESLTAVIGRRVQPPAVFDQRNSARISAAVNVARAAGLSVSDEAVAHAIADLIAGRDPVVSLAAACSARVRRVTLQAGWWTHESTPLLVERLTDGRQDSIPMALLWKRGWKLQDDSGRLVPVDGEVAAHVSRQATELRPVLPGRPGSITDLCRMALNGNAREWLMTGLVTLLLAGLAFLAPILLGRLAGLFINAAPAQAYAALFLALLLIVLAGAAWQAVRGLSLLRARSRAVALASGSVWERIMRLPGRWHSDRTLGDRFVQANSVNNASAALPDETLARLLDSATVIGSLAAIATINTTVLASLAALLLVQFSLVGVLLSIASRRAKERVDASAEAAGTLIQILRSVARLRVSGAESRAFLRWAQVQAVFARSDQALRRVTMLQGVILSTWPLLALLVLVLAVNASGASFGDFITAQAAVTAATVAIASMALAANAALIGRQFLRKAAPVLTAIPEGSGRGAAPGILNGAVEVRDIVFRYSTGQRPVLNGVSVRIAPGEQVAIVGPSGCGKTTLVRIILGLEDAESGVTLVDGRDLAGMDRMAVRKQIGTVLQSGSLLPVSIKENVAMGRPLSQAQVWAALDAAAIGDDIRALAMGMDTPVADSGGTLSGGQRQRILIARALAGNPRVLVMDEATSALDNATQAAIVASLNALKVTRIVVAHRLSTIRRADRIVVMDAGQVVDEGSFEELAGRPGPFLSLIARQEA